MQSIECEMCGEHSATASGQWQDFDYNDGRKTVALKAYVDVVSCTQCGCSYTTGDAEDARHEAVCRHLGRLTPAEIRRIRSVFNLTQAELSVRLDGVSLASIKRWEAGDCIQGDAFDRRLRSLQDALPSERGVAKFAPVFVTKLTEKVLANEAAFQLRPARRQA